ncbi:MAG: SurA N-terminal domain-containing protein [Proteobacteria bacterium]|nr:SurA N-terminal domain-containing protein [Pseudomonadota bacterium]
MLDRMRKHSRSFIIYIFFGIIIGVFVVNFGPQSQGCVADTTHAGAVAGRAITINDISYAMAVAGLPSSGLAEDQVAMLRALILDRYVVRELMAERAIELGLRVPDAEIEDMLLAGRYLALGQQQPLVRGDSGGFDYDLFSRYVRYNWGITVKKFKEEQRRELLAHKLRQLLDGAVGVAPSEVQNDFVQRQTQVQLQYVRFAPSELRERVRLTTAQLDAFAATHQQALRKYYEVNRTAFTGLPQQVLVRALALRAAIGGDRQAAQAAAARLLAKARAGADLGALAREASTDASAGVDGLLGWRNSAAPAIAPAVDAALQQLKDGELSQVIVAGERLYIVRIEGRRSGDVPLAKAEREIALELARDEGARALANELANSFLARIKRGAKLEQLFVAARDEGATTDDATTDEGPAGDGGAAEAPPSATAAVAAAGDSAGAGSPGPDDRRFELRTSSLFMRSPDHTIPGIGASGELSEAVFRLQRGEVADRPFAVGPMVYLVALKDRREADMQEWAERRQELTRSYQDAKAQELVRHVEQDLCQRALERKRVNIDPRILARPAAEGEAKDKSADYVPCRTLQAAGAML